jgi:hypothetical protein
MVSAAGIEAAESSGLLKNVAMLLTASSVKRREFALSASAGFKSAEMGRGDAEKPRVS